ncbi:hypothetical protein L1049_026703 [Liquidambar formosana]|uniref:Glucan endo-1,3-beta-D-glucosidase n=1 Tax=Liquidambar formosana TaxID=63359 RepID=A0AAP0NHH6_LIQFO
MMGLMRNRLIFLTAIAVVLTTQVLPCTGTYHIGVCYGRNGDNLPSPKDVISLYQKCGIEFIRLFEPNTEVLEALRGSNLLVSLGTRNEDIQNLASSQDAANSWVNTNISPYKNDVKFGWISIGNEVLSSDIPQAMINIYNAITSIGLFSTKVTTVQRMDILSTSFPPSAGAFSAEAEAVMNGVASFLSRTGSPLMLNVYPYFAYASEPTHISFEYATLNAKEPVLDGDLKYYSLFEAMVDACYAALEKINAANVSIIASESGWPSAGNEPYTSKEKAQIYNQNLVNRVGKIGTPRRPELVMDAFLFEMFNEDQKPAGIEQNFGLFYPNMEPVYPFFENCRA